jgi:hypothetical protein
MNQSLLTNQQRSQAGPWPRRLVDGLWFAPGSEHVGFVVGKVALGQTFLRVLALFLSI